MRKGYLALLVLLSGCVAIAPNESDAKSNQLPSAAAKLLDRADRVEVLSVDPAMRDRPQMVKPDGTPVPPPPPDTREDFHGFSVLGKTTVNGLLARRNVVSAVKRGIADSDGSVAACFLPRHGVRATVDGKTVDLVICFQCNSIRVYVDGEQAGTVLTAETSRDALDKVLTAAGVPLAPR
jgi:hypothetical protein